MLPISATNQPAGVAAVVDSAFAMPLANGNISAHRVSKRNESTTVVRMATRADTFAESVGKLGTLPVTAQSQPKVDSTAKRATVGIQSKCSTVYVGVPTVTPKAGSTARERKANVLPNEGLSTALRRMRPRRRTNRNRGSAGALIRRNGLS